MLLKTAPWFSLEGLPEGCSPQNIQQAISLFLEK